MPEGYRVRLTTIGDRPTFLNLWKQYLHEEFALGGTIKPTDANLREFCQLFESYMIGSMFGLGVVVHSPEGEAVGLMLCGEDMPGLRFETTLGRASTVWGIYVDPDHRKLRLARAMEDLGAAESLKLGFESVVATYLLSSEAAKNNAVNWGNQAHSINIIGDLHGQQSEV